MYRNEESRAGVQKVQTASDSLNALLNSPMSANAQKSVEGLVQYMEALQNGVIELANVYDADDASPLVDYCKQMQLLGASLIPHIRSGASSEVNNVSNNLRRLLSDIQRGVERAEANLHAFNTKQAAVKQKGAEARLAHSITTRCQRIFDLIDRNPLPDGEFTEELRQLVAEARQAQQTLSHEGSRAQIGEVLKVLLQRGIDFKNNTTNLDTRKLFIDTLTQTLNALISALRA